MVLKTPEMGFQFAILYMEWSVSFSKVQSIFEIAETPAACEDAGNFTKTISETALNQTPGMALSYINW